MTEEVKVAEVEFDMYRALCRRPLIDVIPETGEAEQMAKAFEGSNDITLYSWRNDWLENTRKNLAHYGYFHRDHSVKVFHNELINKPIILVGAGPSLQNNYKYLLTAKEQGVPIMAAHHCIMYFADLGIKPDYVVALDAGKTWEEYFAHGKMDVKDIPLLVDQTCNHEHIKQWGGPVFFFKSAQPDKGSIAKFLKMELDRIIDPNKQGSIIEVGGHVMGAMLSLARGVMVANTIIFAGADYCFRPDGRFYPFDYKIDQVVDGTNFGSPGKELPAPPPMEGQIFDIFGNRVGTSGSYLQFKNVMDFGIKQNVQNAWSQGQDLEFINACEGGALGALKGGNSMWMRYLRLEDTIYYAKAKMALK